MTTPERRIPNTQDHSSTLRPTQKEWEVIAYAAKGLKNREIADLLGISESAVRLRKRLWFEKTRKAYDFKSISDGVNRFAREMAKINNDPLGDAPAISPRLAEYLELLQQDLSYPEIASRLGVSVKTLNIQASKLRSLYGVNTRIGLIRASISLNRGNNELKEENA